MVYHHSANENPSTTATLPAWHRAEVPGVAAHMKYGMIPGQQYAAASSPAVKQTEITPINVPKSQVPVSHICEQVKHERTRI